MSRRLVFGLLILLFALFGTSWGLTLNRDPDIMRDIIKEIKERQGIQAAEDRMKALMTERHRPKDTTTVQQ